MSDPISPVRKSIALGCMAWFNGVAFAFVVAVVHVVLSEALIGRFGSDAAGTVQVTGFGWAVAALGAGTMAGVRVWQVAEDDRTLMRLLLRVWLWEFVTVLILALIAVGTAAWFGGRR